MPESTPTTRIKRAPGRVLVLRALQLGDLLCAVPAFRALRGAWPLAEIVLLSLPWARVFAGRYACYLDSFRELPGWPGLPERPPQPERIAAFLAEIQAERFDLVVQLHGSGGVTNPLAILLGGRHTAGFYVPGQFCPDPGLFLPWPGRGLEMRRLLKLVEFLGLPVQGENLDFPLCEEDFRELHTVKGAAKLRPGEYVCVHPGASVPERRWPPERFAAVADALGRRGLRVVLTGTAPEAGLTAAVARSARTPCLDLAGRTTLGSAAALLAGARLLVCNDTGVSHLAAALKVPSVVVSTGTNPERWAPADARRHRVLCRDEGIRPEEVARHADELLDSEAQLGRKEGPCGLCVS